MPSSRSSHHCSDYYELKTYERLYKCDKCKMIGFGERYVCSLCRNYLHRECKHPKSKATHENFPGYTFEYRSKPDTKRCENNRREFSKCCDACGKDICGISYRYYIGRSESLDLHPCCLKLENKIMIKDTKFDLETKVSSECYKCGKRKISCDKTNVQGLSYVSRCRKYSLHVYCMTDMIQEAYMKREDLTVKERDTKELVRYKRNGKGKNNYVKVAKCFIKILFSFILGDPTALISHAIVECVFLLFGK